MPNAEVPKRQVSPDGQESLLISLPFGSKLPVSERCNHEPNLCSVPNPVVWNISLATRHRSPYRCPGPSCLREAKQDSDLILCFPTMRLTRRVQNLPRGLVGDEKSRVALRSSYSVITCKFQPMKLIDSWLRHHLRWLAAPAASNFIEELVELGSRVPSTLNVEEPPVLLRIG